MHTQEQSLLANEYEVGEKPLIVRPTWAASGPAIPIFICRPTKKVQFILLQVAATKQPLSTTNSLKRTTKIQLIDMPLKNQERSLS